MAWACSLGTVAIATIYLIYGGYRDYLRVQCRRECVLRERVAFLLWRAAGTVGGACLRERRI